MTHDPPYTLRECRKLSLRSIPEITTYMDISKQTLYFWENGSVLISLTHLRRLLTFYGLTLNDVNLNQIIDQAERKKVNA